MPIYFDVVVSYLFILIFIDRVLVHQQLVNVSRIGRAFSFFTTNLWNQSKVVEYRDFVIHIELVVYKLKFKRLISMSENNKDIKMIDSSTSTTKKRNYAKVADFMGSFSDKSSFY